MKADGSRTTISRTHSRAPPTAKVTTRTESLTTGRATKKDIEDDIGRHWNEAFDGEDNEDDG
jgi:hypothetical protein